MADVENFKPDGKIEMGLPYILFKLGRIIAFILAGAFGMSSLQAETCGTMIAELVVAIVLTTVTWYLSWRKDKKLLNAEPPKNP